MKYARYIGSFKRRETFYEIVERNRYMHMSKFPKLSEDIRKAYEMVLQKKVLPSMRSMQFAGQAIEVNPTRIYNCCYLPIDDVAAFKEVMFLLLGGTGVGFSVQKHHVDKLPALKGPKYTFRYLVADSIEGWGDAVNMLVKSYVSGKPAPEFDYSAIRPKGARIITSGGKAPGPEPLKRCLESVKVVLDNAVGRKMKPIEVHDVICHLAEAVRSGGIRRAALISLFSPDDQEMLVAKSGAWWEENPQRGRANNSALLLRGTDEEYFAPIMKIAEESGAGEPGILWSNSREWGTNPCAEIALRPFQMCNLTEINASTVESQEDFEQRCWAASLIGTLQASYTNFHYLRPIWKETTEKEALIGVSMTGIASCPRDIDFYKGAQVVKKVNEEIAKKIGINKAARTTTVKPAGTTSLVLGTSSGIHSWHSRYYIRRVRVGKNEAIYKYLIENHPELVEDEVFDPTQTAVISVPQKAPEGAILRTESALDLLERVKNVYLNWVSVGHRTGINAHNVSATISVRPEEWEGVTKWMWENRDYYNGLSVLPYDGGTYQQAPFEEIPEERFEEFSKMLESLSSLDLTKVIEEEDNTNLVDQAACAGGSCEVR